MPAPRRVLLLTDDHGLRRLTTEFLGGFGVEVATPDTTREALAVMHESAPHLVVVDASFAGSTDCFATTHALQTRGVPVPRGYAVLVPPQFVDHPRVQDHAGRLRAAIIPQGMGFTNAILQRL